MATEQAALGGMNKATTVTPSPGATVPLRESAVLTSAWVATTPYTTGGARYLTLWCKYDAVTSASAARAQIRVMVSATIDTDGSVPEVADDYWYAPTIVDSTPTATVLTGTVETGLTATVTSSEHAVVVSRPMAITIGDTTDAATDKYRQCIKFDVGHCRYFYVAAKELGDTSHPGTLTLNYSLSD